MNELVLSIGSNSSDCQEQMNACIEWLHKILSEIKFSSIYETQAINGIDNAYLNGVVSGKVEKNYQEIHFIMKQYEIDRGRTVESKNNGSIPIDIDIVIWNGQVLRERDYNQSYFQIGWKQLNDKNPVI